jgi:hypothetical protein
MTRIPVGFGVSGHIDAAVTDQVAFAEDLDRSYLYLMNTSTDSAQRVWLGFGQAAVVNEGICLIPNTDRPFIMEPLGVYTGEIHMIAESGTPIVAYAVFRNRV